MSLSKPHRLSDGTTVRVRTVRTIAGTYFEEVPSRTRKASTLYRLGTSMFVVFNGDLARITNPDYAYADDDKSGAALALRFFVDGAEACIAEAAKEGLPVEAMYGDVA